MIDQVCPACHEPMSEHRKLAKKMGNSLFPSALDCVYEVFECPTESNKALWANEESTDRKIPRM